MVFYIIMGLHHAIVLHVQETVDHLLYPNPGSGMVHEQHLLYFHFLGTVLAKVLNQWFILIFFNVFLILHAATFSDSIYFVAKRAILSYDGIFYPWNLLICLHLHYTRQIPNDFDICFCLRPRKDNLGQDGRLIICYVCHGANFTLLFRSLTIIGLCGFVRLRVDLSLFDFTQWSHKWGPINECNTQ